MVMMQTKKAALFYYMVPKPGFEPGQAYTH